MIRPYRPKDAHAVLALNAANVPEVGPLDGTKLALLESESVAFDVLDMDGSVEGALIVLADGGSYGSLNYRWFADRYPRFAYVDRIMLSPEQRGRGWGVELYRRAAAAASHHAKPILTAEVNTVPANPRSLRFHEQFGFVEVGRHKPYGPDEEVAMLELTL